MGRCQARSGPRGHRRRPLAGIRRLDPQNGPTGERIRGIQMHAMIHTDEER
jgi:hypothetical protein